MRAFKNLFLVACLVSLVLAVAGPLQDSSQVYLTAGSIQLDNSSYHGLFDLQSVENKTLEENVSTVELEVLEIGNRTRVMDSMEFEAGGEGLENLSWSASGNLSDNSSLGLNLSLNSSNAVFASQRFEEDVSLEGVWEFKVFTRNVSNGTRIGFGKGYGSRIEGFNVSGMAPENRSSENASNVNVSVDGNSSLENVSSGASQDLNASNSSDDVNVSESRDSPVNVSSNSTDKRLNASNSSESINASADISFDFSPESPVVGEEVVFNASGEGGFSWSFGDGTSGEGEEVRKKYSSAGNFTVSLESGQEVFERSVVVEEKSEPLDAGFEFSPGSAVVGDLLEFDASPSTGVYQSYYEWRFGDGETASGEVVEHGYNGSGNYSVELTVANETSKDSEVKEVEIREGVSTDFSVKPVDPVKGEKVNFSYSGDAENVEWSFGDGDSATGEKVSHAYSEAGSFNVRIEVEEAGVNASGEKVVDVAEVLETVEAVLEFLPESPEVNETVIFNASNSSAESFEWIFSDEKVFNGSEVSRSFESPGEYSVELNASNGSSYQVEEESFRVKPEVNLSGKVPMADVFSRREEWREVGETAMTEGMVVGGGSQAIKDYSFSTPGSVGVRIVPSGGGHRVSFKREYRPVAIVECNPGNVKVNGKVFEKSGEVCKVVLNMDWENGVVSSVNVNGRSFDTSIRFKNDKDGLDRTRIYNPADGRAVYSSVTAP